MKKFICCLLFLFAFSLCGCEDEIRYDYENEIEIKVLQSDISLEVNEYAEIPLRVNDEEDFSDLNFSFSEPFVSIEDDMLIASKCGIAVVTATSKYDKRNKECFTVYVNSPNYKRKTLQLDIPTKNLMPKQKLPFGVVGFPETNLHDNFYLSSSDEDVISFDGDFILAKKEGNAKITVREKKNPSNFSTYMFFVGLQSGLKTESGEPNRTPLILSFEDGDYTISCDKDEQIIIAGANNYQRYYYMTESDKTLIISDTGLVMGLKPGKTTIKVVSKDADTKNKGEDIVSTTGEMTVSIVGERHFDAAEKLLSVALNEEGTREIPYGSNMTKYGEWNRCNGEPWCAIFVSWCANNAGIPRDILPREISVSVYMQRFESKKRFFYKEEYTPEAGDLIIFKNDGRSHVGIVIKSDNEKVYTIEGNTSHMVHKREYPLDWHEITGYCHPDYDSLK